MQFFKQHLFFVALTIGIIVVVIAFSINKQAIAPVEETATTTEALSSEATGQPATQVPVSQTAAKKETKSLSTVTGATSAPAPLTGRIAPDFVQPDGFLNSSTLGIPNASEFILKDFIGKKIILINFWTSSSLNSLRTFPYLNQWDSKYRSSGLMIVSIHTPRFDFERSHTPAEKAVFAHNVLYPIVFDTNYGTWNAYKNTVWPHQYLIDLNGRIVYDHAGEGAYEATEAKIQTLLAARAQKMGTKYTYQTFREPTDAYDVDLAKVKSVEVYAGASRNQALGNGIARKEGIQLFAIPTASPVLNTLYFDGRWNFFKEYVQSMESSRMIYRYSAKRVYALLGADGTVRAKVLLDGKPLTSATAGKDVQYEKGDSVVYVADERIYDIINNTAGYGEHTIEFIPATGGFNIYTLTFG